MAKLHDTLAAFKTGSGEPVTGNDAQQQGWQHKSSSAGSRPPGCMPPFLRDFTRTLRRRASIVTRRPRWMKRPRAAVIGSKFPGAVVAADVVNALKQEAVQAVHYITEPPVHTVNVAALLEGRELCVQLKGAHNLVGADWAGISNPYAKVRVGGNEQQTQHIRATTNPRWNNTFLYSQADVAAAKGVVQIEVWSYDSFHPDDFLGQTELDLSAINLADSRASLLRLPLVVLKPNGKKEEGEFGELFLSVWSMPTTKAAVAPGEQGPVVDTSAPQIASMCGGNIHLQLPSMVHAGMGTLYEEPCVVYIRVTLVALERLDALVEGRTCTMSSFATDSCSQRFLRRSGDAGSASSSLNQRTGGTSSTSSASQLRRPCSSWRERRPCFLSQLTQSSSRRPAAREQAPSSPLAARSSSPQHRHGHRHVHGQSDDAGAGQIEGVSRHNPLDDEQPSDDDSFDDSAMERDSSGDGSSSMAPELSMGAVLERLRAQLGHSDSTLTCSEDAVGHGPYMYCKVTYAKQSYHTRMLRLRPDGSLHLHSSFVFCDVRPLHDRPLQIDVYATSSRKSRGRLVGQLALPLLDLAADCSAAEPGPGVRVAYEDGKGVVRLLAVSRGLDGRAGGTAVLHAGIADADHRAAIYCMELRADQPPTECTAFMEVAAASSTGGGAAICVNTGAAVKTISSAPAGAAAVSTGVVVEVPVADSAWAQPAAEAAEGDEGCTAPVACAGAAIATAIANAAAGAQGLLEALAPDTGETAAEAAEAAAAGAAAAAAGVDGTADAVGGQSLTSAMSASSDGPFRRHASSMSGAASAWEQHHQERPKEQQQQQAEDPAQTATTSGRSRWLTMGSSGGRTVALLQAAAARIWREHEVPVAGPPPEVGSERVLSTVRMQLHSVELLTHLRSVNWCLVGNVGPNWMITKPSQSESAVFAWEIMAPLYAPDSVITLALFSVPTGLRAKESPTMLGKVRTIVSAMEPDVDHSFTLLIPAYSASSSGDSASGNVASVRATFRVQYCGGWKDMVAAYARAPRPAAFYELGLEEESEEQLETLRRKIIFRWLEHSQPAIHEAMAEKVLETHRDAFSMRRLKTNYRRVIDAYGWAREVGQVYDRICTWQYPGHSLAAVALVVMIAAMPSRMFATLLLLLVGVMVWRKMQLEPQPAWGHQNVSSQQDSDEGADVPLSSIAELKRRYDQVASVALTVQNMMDTVATFSERMQALMSWRDPVASTIFAALFVLIVAATVVLPGGLRTVMAAAALYLMRPPIIRDALPPLPLLLFEKLPSAADVM